MSYCIWLISLNLLFSRLFYTVACMRISFLFKAEYHSMCVNATFCLSFHLLMNPGVASTFWLLLLMLLGTMVHKHLSKSLLPVLWGCTSGGLPDCSVTLCSSSSGTSFSMAAAPVYAPASNAWEWPFSRFLPVPVPLCSLFSFDSSSPTGWEVASRGF